MTIISLNTWGGVLLEPLLDFFRKHQHVDVFCLQEVYRDAIGKDKPHPTLDMKLDLYEHIETQLKQTHIGYFRPAYKKYFGQAMFIKRTVPVLEEGDVCIYKNENPERRGQHSRNLQYARLPFRGSIITIANVHGLWNGQGKSDTPQRIEQSKNIQTFLHHQENPCVLVGDFNLHPGTQSLAIIESGLRNLISEFGITSTRTHLYEKEGKFADYAFVPPEVPVKTFGVLPDVVSDHAALFLEVS